MAEAAKSPSNRTPTAPETTTDQHWSSIATASYYAGDLGPADWRVLGDPQLAAYADGWRAGMKLRRRGLIDSEQRRTILGERVWGLPDELMQQMGAEHWRLLERVRDRRAAPPSEMLRRLRAARLVVTRNDRLRVADLGLELLRRRETRGGR